MLANRNRREYFPGMWPYLPSTSIDVSQIHHRNGGLASLSCADDALAGTENDHAARGGAITGSTRSHESHHCGGVAGGASCAARRRRLITGDTIYIDGRYHIMG